MTEAQASGANAPAAMSNSVPNTQSNAPVNAQAVATDFRGTKHKVKIGGQEREVDYDTLLRDYQLGQASNDRFQEASRKEKEAQATFAALERGDFGYLEQKLGPAKARQAAEQYLMEKLEYDALPEHEKRARALAEENKNLKSEAEKRKEAADKAEHEATVVQAHHELDIEIKEALKDYKNPTPRLVLRILGELDARLDVKHQRIPVAEAKKHAVEGIFQDIAEFLPTLPPEELIKRLPKPVLDAIRSHEVQQVMGEKQGRRIKVTGELAKPKEPMTHDQWFKQMEQSNQKRRRG